MREEITVVLRADARRMDREMQRVNRQFGRNMQTIRQTAQRSGQASGQTFARQMGTSTQRGMTRINSTVTRQLRTTQAVATRSGQAAGQSYARSMATSTQRGMTATTAAVTRPLSQANTQAAAAGTRAGQSFARGVTAATQSGMARTGASVTAPLRATQATATQAGAAAGRGYATAFETQIGTAIARVRTKFSGLFSSLRGQKSAAGAGFGGLGSQIRGMGVAGATAFGMMGIGKFVGEMAGAGKSINDTRAALTGMYGSAEDATYMIDRMNSEFRASRVGIDSFNDLSVALAYVGVEGDEAITMLQNMETGSARLGDRAPGAMKAVADELNKGVVQGYLMNDSLGRISETFPIYDALAEYIGVSSDEVRDMASAHEIAMDDVLHVLGDPSYSQYWGMMSDAAENTSETAAGALDSIRRNFINMGGLIVDRILTRISPALADMAASFEDATNGIDDSLSQVKETMDDWGVTDAMKTAAEAVKSLAQGAAPLLGAFATGVGAAFAGLMVLLEPVFGMLRRIGEWMQENRGVVRAFGVVLGVLVGLFLAFKAALAIGGTLMALLNPVGLVMAGIAALGAALYYAWENSETFRDGVTRAWEVIQEAWEHVWETTLKPGLAQLAEWWAETWPRLREIFAAAWQRMKEIFLEVWEDAIRPGLADIVEWVRENWPEIRQAFVNVFQGIKDWWDENGDEVFRRIRSAAQSIKDWWDDNGDDLKETIEDFFDDVKEKLDEAKEWWDENGEAVVRWGLIIVGALLLTMVTVGVIFAGIIAVIAGFIGFMIWVQLQVNKIIMTIIGFFVDLYERLVGNSIIPDLVESITDWWDTLYDNSIGRIEDLVDGVVDTLSGLKDRAKSHWDNFTGMMESGAEGVSKRLVGNSIIPDMVSSIISATGRLEGGVGPNIGAMSTDATQRAMAMQTAMVARMNTMSQQVTQSLVRMSAAVTRVFAQMGQGLGTSLMAAIRQIMQMVTSLVAFMISRVRGMGAQTNSQWAAMSTRLIRTTQTMSQTIVRVLDDMGRRTIAGFARTVSGVQSAWGRLRQAVAAPVRYVISPVYNSGLRPVWNRVADRVPGLSTMSAMSMPSFDRGGMVDLTNGGSLSGFSTKDNRLAKVRDGESVLTPSATRGLGGKAFVDAANQSGTGASKLLAKGVEGFSRGGIVSLANRFKAADDDGFSDGAPRAARAALDPMAGMVGSRYGRGDNFPGQGYHSVSGWNAGVIKQVIEHKDLLEGGDGGAVVDEARKHIGKSGRPNEFMTPYMGGSWPWCFAAGTLVRTPQGQVAIEDLSAGDTVLAPSGTERRIQTTFTRTKPLMRVRILGVLETLATADHPYMTDHGWKRAGDLKRGDMVAKPIPATGEQDVDLARAELLGWYLAEGSRSKGNGVQFNLNPAVADHVVALAHEAGFTPHVYQDRTCIRVTVYDAPLAADADTTGRRAEHKQIPPMVFTWNRKGREAFLHGYAQGDGYRTGPSVKASTVSPALAVSLSDLLLTLDLHAAVRLDRGPQEHVIEGRTVQAKAKYVIHWREAAAKTQHRWDHTGGVLWVPVRSVEETGREEKVYDLTVDEEHAFVANGAHVSNCGAFVGTVFKNANAYDALDAVDWKPLVRSYRTLPKVPASAARPGDLPLYRGDDGHINIVEDPARRTSIGGNESDAVRRQTGYMNTASSIRRPNFARGGMIDYAQAFWNQNSRETSDILAPQDAMMRDIFNGVQTYDQGGWLAPGYTLAYNDTGSPEPIGAEPIVVTIDLKGDDADMIRRLRKQVKIKGGGNVQVALGNGGGRG